MDKPSGDLRLNYAAPTVTSDGHVVMISDQGIPTLLFFQARDQHEGHLHADVVAGIRFNSVEDLKNLSKAIDETTKNFKNREP